MINLSIIIPIYKESRNIQNLSKDITDNIDIKNYEILFIDDNSNDGTEEILKKLNEGNRNIKYIIRKERKIDLSKSCILGFDNSMFDNILVMDGDLQHNPIYIPKMLSVYKKHNCDIVIGARNLIYRRVKSLSFFRQSL